MASTRAGILVSMALAACGGATGQAQSPVSAGTAAREGAPGPGERIPQPDAEADGDGDRIAGRTTADPCGGGEITGDGGGGMIGHGLGTGAGASAPGGRTNAPVVELGTPTVTGKLAREVVQRSVKRSRTRFTECYAEVLERKPAFETARTVTFDIEPGGRAVKVAMGAGGVRDEALDRCVLDEVEHIEFAKPERGAVKVEYPIVFTPGR